MEMDSFGWANKYLYETKIDFTAWETTWAAKKRARKKHHYQATLQAAGPHLSDLGGSRLANVALPVASFALRRRLPIHCQEYPDRKLVYIYKDTPSERDTADLNRRRERSAKVASTAARRSQRHSYIVVHCRAMSNYIVSTIYYH